MTKFKKIFKWTMVISVPLLILYGALWFKILYDLCAAINLKYTSKPLEINKNYNVSFKKAVVNWDPFSFSIKLFEFTENSQNSIIKHSAPLVVGYNILSQHLYTYYKGESTANYLPLNSGFGAKVTGEYKNSIDLPMSSKLFKILKKGDNLFEVFNFLNSLKINFKDVVVKDLVDDTLMVGNANVNIQLDVTHDKYYNNIEEFASSPPKDYDIKFKTHIRDVGQLKLIMPASLIYGYYPAYQFKYGFNAHLHTEAKNIAIADIIKDLRLQADNIEYSDNLQNSSSSLLLESYIKDKNLEWKIDYNTKLKTFPGYTKALEDNLRIIAKLLPSLPATQDIKRIFSTIDVAGLNINTDKDPIDIKLKSTFTEKDGELSIKLDHFEMNYQDSGFTLTTTLGKDENKEFYSEGALAITNYDKLIDYATSSYFTINQYSDNGDFNHNFYQKLNKDFVKKIANSIDEKASSLAIKYSTRYNDKDIDKARIGKYLWPEATLLYYSMLFKEVSNIIKDPAEAIAKFKEFAPENILEKNILDKIVAVQ